MSWTDQDFIEKIYNEDYILVDPDYVENRHLQNAALLSRIFGPYRKNFRHLDYGGGNGVLSGILRKADWNSSSYDPFPTNDRSLATLGTFNFITAFEVFEHVPDPQLMMNNINLLLSGTEALIFFSTGVSDGLINDNERLSWWYAAPRNGHIGIHTTQSLKVLGERNNFNFVSLGPSFHVYFRSFPEWAKGLIEQ
jgi:hypothetical protein